MGRGWVMPCCDRNNLKEATDSPGTRLGKDFVVVLLSRTSSHSEVEACSNSKAVHRKLTNLIF